MRLVFMGTPDFARACLETLHTEGFDIAAVYTKPDTPKNRGMKLIPSEVKAYAVSVGLPVVQPYRRENVYHISTAMQDVQVKVNKWALCASVIVATCCRC